MPLSLCTLYHRPLLLTIHCSSYNLCIHIFPFSAGGNKLKGQLFRLDWVWISLEKEYYVVDEEDKFLEVIVRRRGYLGETSFIGQSTRLFSSVSTSQIGRPGRRTDGGELEEK